MGEIEMHHGSDQRRDLRLSLQTTFSAGYCSAEVSYHAHVLAPVSNTPLSEIYHRDAMRNGTLYHPLCDMIRVFGILESCQALA